MTKSHRPRKPTDICMDSTNKENQCEASETSSTSGISVRPLESTDWQSIEELFGGNGACGGCWCMNWRVAKGGLEWEATKGETSRQAFRKLIEGGKVNGILAFAGKEAVGWCSVDRAQAFPRLMRNRALYRTRTRDTWVVTCFYVKKQWRGRGLSVELLESAVRLAEVNGAVEIEGFPVRTKAYGKRLPGPFVWTGVSAIFRAVGFVEEQAANSTRCIALKRLCSSETGLS